MQHKPPISEEDLRKVYSSSAFNINTPVGLQNKVWFEVTLFFCPRQENLCDLKRDELIKNHREDSEGQEGGLMYEIPGSAMCPVLPMEKYIAKLNPNNPAFFSVSQEAC